MNEQDALLRSILAAPGDDTARLIYADWLEENGQEPRARLIRYQVTFSSMGSSDDRKPVRKAVSLLFRKHRETWAGKMAMKSARTPGGNGGHIGPYQSLGRGISMRLVGKWVGARDCNGVQDWRRGFVASVTGSIVALVHNAEWIFSTHPVERVGVYYEMSWMRPVDGCREWEIHPDFPPCLMQLIPRSFRRATNVNVLAIRVSQAVMSFGRRLAGLPPLPAPTETAAHA